MPTISKERIQRAARMYSSNIAASQALGITPETFGRLCRHYDIRTPIERRQARRAEAMGNKGSRAA